MGHCELRIEGGVHGLDGLDGGEDFQGQETLEGGSPVPHIWQFRDRQRSPGAGGWGLAGGRLSP